MSRKDLQAKKRHHYVWASYLARWGDAKKNVFYTTKKGNIANDSVRAILAEEYFYKTSTLTASHIKVIQALSQNSPEHLHMQHMSYLNDFLKLQHAELIYRQFGTRNKEIERQLHATKCNLLENLHASHEKKAQPILHALAEERLEVLKDKQNIIEFMMFFGHQISRTKAFRDGVILAQPRRNELEVEVADAMCHAWWFVSYMFGMSLGFNMFADRHNTNHALLVNDTGVPFITSDHPVVNVHSCISETVFAAPDYADFYYPISPRIAYIVCDSGRFAPGRNEVDETTVVELNMKVASQAMVHIIGSTESSIILFKKYVGRRFRKIPTGNGVN